jgi:N-acetylmuramoyl-L-alanine amidase
VCCTSAIPIDGALVAAVGPKAITGCTLNNSRFRQLGLHLCAVPLFLSFAVSAHGSAHKSEAWARTQFAAAENMREQLNANPAQNRTRLDYRRLITAYRKVYYGAPASTKADPSVAAVAELLIEEGRRFEDDNLLRSAIGQYEFLRGQYPGSRHRVEALLTIGRIYRDDLDDGIRAREAFQEFMRLYPRHPLAEQVRAELTEPVEQATLKSPDVLNLPKASVRRPPTKPSQDSTSVTPATLTGIRHWATSGSIRVAIDLEQDVKFASQRIEHPDRIILDLEDTIPGATLAGKNLDINDGALKKIRIAQFAKAKTRVVLDVDESADYRAFLLQNPSRLIVDIRSKNDRSNQSAAAGTATGSNEPAQPTATGTSEPAIPATPLSREPATSSTKSSIGPKSAESVAPKRRIVEADDDDDGAEAAVPTVNKPAHNITTMASLKTKSNTAANRRKSTHSDVDAREAQPTAHGDRSLIRALGLKIGRIVIDPGHGGHDTGTIGPHGLEEKDLVLEVGRRLGNLLQARMGAEVIYTRRDDTFIPLETRTGIANEQQADLFVSIHANSSRDADARGVETYYLNFTSSAEALEVAARENSVSDNAIHELQDLVKKIALKDKIEESREFAADVQRSLHSGLAAKSPGIRDRGVKKAPFIVLIGANMPSILAEISFVSNPGDERRLRTAEYRQKIAESLYRGIAKYVSGLSGVKVASRIEKEQGQ